MWISRRNKSFKRKEKEAIYLPKVKEGKEETMHTREQEGKEEIIYTREEEDQINWGKKRASRKGRTN